MTRIDGDEYRVTPEELERFRRDGYVHLAGVVSAAELADLERVYEQFLRREIPVPGRDFCDMSGAGRAPDDFALVNIMLPRRYHPAWMDNVFERRARSIAIQLQGDGLTLDYDQLLAKRPRRAEAVFAWHQDMAYWIETEDTRTATVWLALDDSTLENGCMRFVPGSQREPRLRPHRPILGDRGRHHALQTDVDPGRDEVRPVPIARGDVTVHDERVIHGSGGNHSDGWRRAYVVAFRAATTVSEERRRGFTHSHEDAPEVLGDVGVEGQTRAPPPSAD